MLQQTKIWPRWMTTLATIALFALAAFGPVIAAPFAAFTDTWQIDPVHTNVGFSVCHKVEAVR